MSELLLTSSVSGRQVQVFPGCRPTDYRQGRCQVALQGCRCQHPPWCRRCRCTLYLRSGPTAHVRQGLQGLSYPTLLKGIQSHRELKENRLHAFRDCRHGCCVKTRVGAGGDDDDDSSYAICRRRLVSIGDGGRRNVLLSSKRRLTYWRYFLPYSPQFSIHECNIWILPSSRRSLLKVMKTSSLNLP